MWAQITMMIIVIMAPARPASMYGVYPPSDSCMVSILVLIKSATSFAIMPAMKPRMAIIPKVFILLFICSLSVVNCVLLLFNVAYIFLYKS